MRKWTTSACVALAWSILIVPLLAAAGRTAPGHPAQATASTAITNRATLASAPGAPRSAPPGAPGRAQMPPAGESAAAPAGTIMAVKATAVTWTVRPGDTLSAIAAALAVPGGWPTLYAANRHAVGPDPDVLRPGTVLALPAAAAPARYTVAPGDTLSAIAAALAVPGGWPALYAANRHAVGPDPDVLRPGTVLALPHLPPAVAAGAAARGRARRGTAPALRHRAPLSRDAAAPAGAVPPPGAKANAPHPDTAFPSGPGHPAAGGKASGGMALPEGMPRWLEDVLLVVGLLAASAFAAEPAAAFARRHRAAAAAPVTLRVRGRKRRRAARARIVLADHDRLVVTYCADEHTVYVLAPPGEDARAVLRAARLVLPDEAYEDLAGHLGVPSAWPAE